MKKCSFVLICAILIATMLTLSISAAVRWNTTFQLAMSMGYNPNTEIASVYVNIIPQRNSAVYEIDVALEQFTTNGWTEVHRWPRQVYSGAYFDFYGYTDEQMESGFTYRVHVSGYVDDGFGSDYLDQYSDGSVLQ